MCLLTSYQFNIRSNDDIYRIGGDEFIIVFRKMMKDQIYIKMEHIKKKIDELDVHGINIKFSYGVKIKKSVDVSGIALLKQADELIDKLAQVYRYNLDNRQNEVVPLSYEITSLNPVLDIFRAKFGPSVSLEVKIDQTDDYQLIPGTFKPCLNSPF